MSTLTGLYNYTARYTSVLTVCTRACAQAGTRCERRGWGTVASSRRQTPLEETTEVQRYTGVYRDTRESTEVHRHLQRYKRVDRGTKESTGVQVS